MSDDYSTTSDTTSDTSTDTSDTSDTSSTDTVDTSDLPEDTSGSDGSEDLPEDDGCTEETSDTTDSDESGESLDDADETSDVTDITDTENTDVSDADADTLPENTGENDGSDDLPDNAESIDDSTNHSEESDDIGDGEEPVDGNESTDNTDSTSDALPEDGEGSDGSENLPDNDSSQEDITDNHETDEISDNAEESTEASDDELNELRDNEDDDVEDLPNGEHFEDDESGYPDITESDNETDDKLLKEETTDVEQADSNDDSNQDTKEVNSNADYLSAGSNDLYGVDRISKDDYSIQSLKNDLERMRNEQYAQENYMNSTYPDDMESKSIIYNRLADQYSGVAEKYMPTCDKLKQERNDLQTELENYDGTDQNYVKDTQERINQLNGDIDSYQKNIDFANNVARDMKMGEQTEFKSVNGKDFTSSHDGMISKQHDSDCGVCSYSNSKGQVTDIMPNEQKEFESMRNNGTCDRTGGTTESTIRKQCQSDGLRGETIKKPSATQVHDIIKNGDGCMIALKSDQLKSGGILPKGEADHFVNVVGSEYNKKGEAIGFWVNNSNRCTGTNKVYLSNDGFNNMVGRTGGFLGGNPITATSIRSK